MDQGGVKVIYSGLGEKADAVIKRIITAERREWIVISSDRDVIAFAWSAGGIPVPSALFFSLLEGGKAVGTRKDDEGQGHDGRGRKGNAMKPSKREKALQRALARL